jgi:hypothetical protein
MPFPIVTPPGPRKNIRAALLSLVQGMTFGSPINGASTWVTSGPRLKHWSDVPSSDQPAAFVTSHRERRLISGQPSPLGLERRILNLLVYCYSRTDDPAAVGSDDLDTMLEAFDVALAFDKPGTLLLTFGGLAYYGRIEGTVFQVPGDIDNQTMMIVPVVVEMP